MTLFMFCDINFGLYELEKDQMNHRKLVGECLHLSKETTCKTSAITDEPSCKYTLQSMHMLQRTDSLTVTSLCHLDVTHWPDYLTTMIRWWELCAKLVRLCEFDDRRVNQAAEKFIIRKVHHQNVKDQSAIMLKSLAIKMNYTDRVKGRYQKTAYWRKNNV